MPLPPSPIDFTTYDAAKGNYDQSEADYKAKSAVRDQAQEAFDAAEAALTTATTDLEHSNAVFQQDLAALVTECDKVGVPYPPDMQAPAQLPSRR